MPYPQQKRRLAYFRPGQITFLATHQRSSLSDEDLTDWIKEIKEHLKGGTIEGRPRAFSFGPLSEYPDGPSEDEAERLSGAFSIIACDMKGVPDDPKELLERIVELNGQLKDRTFAGLMVKAVSPNWLSSATSEGGGTGGPGSWPVPFRGIPDRAPYDFPKLKDALVAAGLKGDGENDGENVDVAILDTAPCPHDLVAAHKEWRDQHPLIRTLLGPEGKLRLYPATYDELRRMGSTSLNQHDFKMTDHGLFAAGIVHSIAPKATIHLIEVLNPFGVGDLATLAGGLMKVFRDIYRPERRLVVNCSWMLELPVVDKHRHAESETDPEFEFEQAVLQFAKNDRDQAFALRAVCNRLWTAGGQAIAAAGNDWREKKARPGAQHDFYQLADLRNSNDWRDKKTRLEAPTARYPAGFVSSIGVGALPKDAKTDPNDPAGRKYVASSYSNLADKPAENGIMTLGGEPGEEKGVLGLYLGEFPGGGPNCTKWAWWAGTSFATPILTGAIAAVLGNLTAPVTTTQDAIHALYTNGIIQQRRTLANEDAMDAILTKQDYAPSP